MKKVAAESIETWRLKATCKGDEYSVGNKACGTTWELNGNDIVRRRVVIMYDYETDIYGFICPECNTFTEIHQENIPIAIRNNCPYYFATPRKK